ncbi:phosphatidate cytidylyltransferase [Salirhabdus euzebyi]|uniref:Phosphatidate cytidylyltransferase n=1 Tax=Salirhabdus euzebyi TaxID=394506 RepID=A0A841Q3C1_9BACI|nr:phosphatidate cytidylyltransferase [Salirhabdus euzebyi]MBB6452890.1 phosphatidate cytidylyltransferase [Salirhabdus euzebyi]
MKERIITAIIGLIIFIPIIIYGDWLFQLAVFLLASASLLELLRMKKIRVFSWASLISLFILWTLLYDKSVIRFSDSYMLTKTEIIIIGVLILLAYTVLVKNRFTYDEVGFIVVSVIYVGIGFYFLIQTREAGLVYIAYVFLVIWATDTGAYFVGRAIGKKKLWPIISPKKTIEGFYGGIVLAVIVAAILQFLYPFHESMLIVILVTMILSIVGQIGDLVESAIKRFYDVKDSGSVLPGHGGILDRFDSLIFMMPVLHLIHFI